MKANFVFENIAFKRNIDPRSILIGVKIISEEIVSDGNAIRIILEYNGHKFLLKGKKDLEHYYDDWDLFSIDPTRTVMIELNIGLNREEALFKSKEVIKEKYS